VIEAKQHRKAKLVVVDPRFTRSASMADYYAPIRAGSDIAFLAGVINYLLSKDKVQKEYVKHYTNASSIVGEGYSFKDGIFSGYYEAKRSYSNASWADEMDEKGFAKVDDSGSRRSFSCWKQLASAARSADGNSMMPLGKIGPPWPGGLDSTHNRRTRPSQDMAGLVAQAVSHPSIGARRLRTGSAHAGDRVGDRRATAVRRARRWHRGVVHPGA
jgi:nitrate reductase alpha subunit